MIRRNFNRTDRVGDALHRTLASFVRDKFREDPRIGMVTISTVKMSPDLKHAKVFITVFEEDKAAESLRLLNQAAPLFRSHLAKTVSLRVVPIVAFILDDSTARAHRIYTLLGHAVDSN
jgi:ribosome-binding factor A